MEHFSESVVNLPVVDARGERIGKIAGIEDGFARLHPRTGVQSRMGGQLSPPDVDGLAIRPEQVVEVVTQEGEESYVRVDLELAAE